jgi:L-erythro-3,5-diaminohexanoate dehydrogenase
MSIADNEILIDVSALNVDAASFTQIKAEAGGDAKRVGEIVCGIVAQRGKLHNPVTGSGGMLIGTVAAMGSALAGKWACSPATRSPRWCRCRSRRCASTQIRAVHLDRDQIEIDWPGRALRDGPVRQAARRHPRKDGAGHSGRGRRTGADRAPGAPG